MKIILFIGDHPRHYFFANAINSKYPLSAAIIYKREKFVLKPPPNLQSIDKKNFVRHFEDRKKTEEKFFQNQNLPKTSLLFVNNKNLNSKKTINFIKKIKPTISIIFGTGIIKEQLRRNLSKNTMNFHLGISPRYRGAATLFWPFYFLEPGYCGGTFHYLLDEPDYGDIIHQFVPKLSIKDGIHDVACKVVKQSTKETIKLLDIFKKKRKWKRFRQKSTGKNFLVSDFMPQHLRLIYNVYNNNIVKFYLQNFLSRKKPNLKKQF